MNGSEFERMIRRRGRLYYGDRFTTLKDRTKEISPGLLKAMLDQLGLSKSDVET